MIVADYRSQSDVEADFRQMKDPEGGLVLTDVPLDRPQDPGPRLLLRARPHGRPPACVREAAQHRMHMSVRELLDTLAGIQETVLLYQGERGRPRARRMLTEIDPTQRRLYDLFGLDAYAPER